MAWVWQEQALESGVVVDPRDFTRNQAVFAGEFNGHIDRDNVGEGAVTSGKPVVKGIVEVFSNPQSGSPLQQIAAGQSGAWHVISSATTTVDTEDGEVIVDADVNAQWETYGVRNNKWACQLVVNGIPIANTGWTHLNRMSTVQSMTGSAVVTKGQTTIQVLVRTWADAWTEIAEMNAGTAPANTRDLNEGYTTFYLNIVAVNVCGVHRKR